MPRYALTHDAVRGIAILSPAGCGFSVYLEGPVMSVSSGPVLIRLGSHGLNPWKGPRDTPLVAMLVFLESFVTRIPQAHWPTIDQWAAGLTMLGCTPPAPPTPHVPANTTGFSHQA